MTASLLVVLLAVFLFGLVSGRLHSSMLTPPLVFTALGMLFGKLGWWQFGVSDEWVLTLAEFTLVLVLFGDATRIDLSLLRKEGSLALRLLGVGLPACIVLGGIVAALLLSDLQLIEAALLAAILAPTDAALGQAVVSNEQVPVRIRQTLNVESGLNDGICFPAVFILATLAGAEQGEQSIRSWVQFVTLQLTLGPLMGVLVGYVGGRVTQFAFEANWMNRTFLRLTSVVLALLAYGLADISGGNGFIAAFVAGLTLGQTAQAVCGSLREFVEAEGQLLTLMVFILFGVLIVSTVLPFVSWPVVAYALLSLSIIRMLPVAVSLLGTGLHTKSFLFLGWFGPRGIASVIFSLMMLNTYTLEHGQLVVSTALFTVLLSVVLHGLSAAPGARWYARQLQHNRQAHHEEHKPVADMPLRLSKP